MGVNSSIYNPFVNTTGKLGGIHVFDGGRPPSSPSPYGQAVRTKDPVFYGNGNIFGDVARNATLTPTGEGAALGYGKDGDTPEYKDNAWRRFLSTMSPYLSAGQLSYLGNQRALFDSATADAQAQDTGYHFADVLGNSDVVRLIQGASPFSLGASSRYMPIRFR